MATTSLIRARCVGWADRQGAKVLPQFAVAAPKLGHCQPYGRIGSTSSGLTLRCDRPSVHRPACRRLSAPLLSLNRPPPDPTYPPPQDIAEVLHLPNVLGLGDSTFGSPLASPKGSAYSTGHFGHNHPQRAAPDQRNGGGAEGMHTLPIEPHSTSPASARVAPRPVYEVGNELSHTLSPTSMSGALGYVKGKFRRGPSGSCIGASGSRAGTEMEELVRRHSPSWAKEEDACVREAASDAVSRLSRIISPLAVRPPQLDTDGEVPPSGARIDDGADDVYQATAEILLEEEQRRCAAYASMGDTEAGREVYATAVRQLISRLTRRLGHGRRRNRAAAGDDDLESDEVPTEVCGEAPRDSPCPLSRSPVAIRAAPPHPTPPHPTPPYMP